MKEYLPIWPDQWFFRLIPSNGRWHVQSARCTKVILVTSGTEIFTADGKSFILEHERTNTFIDSESAQAERNRRNQHDILKEE